MVYKCVLRFVFVLRKLPAIIWCYFGFILS
jgi:hypothetical protein